MSSGGSRSRSRSSASPEPRPPGRAGSPPTLRSQATSGLRCAWRTGGRARQCRSTRTCRPRRRRARACPAGCARRRSSSMTASRGCFRRRAYVPVTSAVPVPTRLGCSRLGRAGGGGRGCRLGAGEQRPVGDGDLACAGDGAAERLLHQVGPAARARPLQGPRCRPSRRGIRCDRPAAASAEPPSRHRSRSGSARCRGPPRRWRAAAAGRGRAGRRRARARCR